MSESIYDIPIKSWDGQENFLEKYKGKVTLIVNTTGACGNAPQFGILEEIYQSYKDKGFEIIAVPTNQFCGPKVTYGDHEGGIASAEVSRDHGKDVYGATYDFSEMVVAKPGAPWDKKIPEGEAPHDLFERLVSDSNALMYGNFEKWLVGRDGKFIKRYANGTLLDFAFDNNAGIGPAAEEYETLTKDIEAAL